MPLPNVAYTVNFEDAPAADWQLRSLQCEEELDGGCAMTLELTTDTLDAELGEFLGASCEVIATRGDAEHAFYGVVLRVDLLGRDDTFIALRVHVVSALELAQQRRHSRIWQASSANEIVAEVLDGALADYGRSIQLDATQRGDSPRTYCVQYRETDYDYVHRLLEEEGITYFLHHDPELGHEVVVMCDANSQYPEAENLDGSPDFPLIASNNGQAEVESLIRFEWIQKLTTTAILRRDFDWQTPSDLLSAEAGEPDARGRTRRLYSHGQRLFKSDDLGDRARDRGEALGLASSVATGASNALALRPGMRFSTAAHAEMGTPGEFIVTRVRHRGRDPASGGGTREDTAYINEFECVSFESPLRPKPRTPKPSVEGPQTATVVGDGEIYVDPSGRIQVQFHWQESPSFATDASCWVRCAQSWAGQGWGAQFIPRVGMEVVVEFIEGNPDRPLVTGCVYNGNHEPPFSLPDNATQSGWRTHSSPGGGGSNELRFTDDAGAEEIYIHGQKDWNVAIENDTSKSTGVDETLSVGHDRTKTVGNNQSETIGVDKTIDVGSDHGETIGSDMALSVGANETLKVGTNQTITVGSAVSETIASTATQLVTAAKATTVYGAFAVSVGGAMATSIAAAVDENVGGAKIVEVGGASLEKTADGYSLDAKAIDETAKSTFKLDAGEDLSISAKTKLDLESGGPLSIETAKAAGMDAGDKFTIKCGSAKMIFKKDGSITFKGKKVTFKGSTSVTLDSAKIVEN